MSTLKIERISRTPMWNKPIDRVGNISPYQPSNRGRVPPNGGLLPGMKNPVNMNQGNQFSMVQGPMNQFSGLDNDSVGAQYALDGGLGKNIEIGGVMPEGQGLGGWMDPQGKGGLALGAAGIGLGVYNALEQAKMNKFMREEYYGPQMDLERTDFQNAARGTNEALSGRRERQLSAQGVVGDESKAAVGAYMDQWGVDETF